MGGRRFAYILVLLGVVLIASVNGEKNASPGCRVVQLGKKLQCRGAGLSKIPKIPKRIMIADFTDNLITHITQEDWKNLEKLQKVYLKGNPFHCDCNLEWLRLKLDNSPAVIQDGDSIQCATPSKIHNKPLKSLSNLCEIKSHVETLNTRGIESGSYLLLSIDKKYHHLLVGAKDNAFLVDLENIQDFKSWNLTNPATSACDRKQDGICHDFVKIMLPFNERIFLCWAGTPMTAGCAWRNRTDLSDAPGRDNQGNVFTADVEYSSSSDQNDTAIITEHGRIFIGTINPYSAKSIIHSRSFKRPKLHSVFTSWLDHSDFYTDVHFVKSFNIGHYVYFFFRERILECSSCGKLKVSRVARICKGDYGGRYSHRKHFVTFQKAKLTCLEGEDFQGNFNEIQDVWWDEQTNLFHATFIAQPCRNGPPSSAICVYNLSDINHVFDKSSFKSFNNDAKQWVTVANNYKKYFHNCKVNPKEIDPSNTARVPEGMMATRKMTYSAYRELMHDPLMEDPVKPTSFNSHSKKVSRAWFIKDGIWMTAIALDKVGATTVVYASTDKGSVLKISKPAGANQPCLLTELDVFSSDKKEVIKAMTIDTTRLRQQMTHSVPVLYPLDRNRKFDVFLRSLPFTVI